jgi:hypothetical protein
MCDCIHPRTFKTLANAKDESQAELLASMCRIAVNAHKAILTAQAGEGTGGR